MKEQIKKHKPIRIAYIIGKMCAGGVESVVFNYYRVLNHNIFQFDFFYDDDSTIEPPKELIDMGARFFKLPRYQNLFKYLNGLRKYLKQEQYLIVHSHLNTLSVFPLFVAWFEQVPIRIAHNHSVPGGSDFIRNTIKHILRYFSKLFSTHYFACSEKAGRWMFGDYVFDSNKVFIMKNAIDFEKFRVDSNNVLKKKLELNIQNKFVVGHVGRFTYAKNHLFLLDIFKCISELRNDAVLLLVGDGELRSKIENEIKNKCLENKVLFAGRVPDPEKYYRLNDVIVLPSVFEGLSLTAIESQIAGVPIIMSKAVPQEAVISDGCWYMDITDSAEAWAKKAVEVAGKNIISLTDKADDYDIKKQVKKIENWYESTLKKTGINI